MSDVTSDGLDYAAAANHDPDGDSDGTSIVVAQTTGDNAAPVAAFTWSCAELDCDFTDGSTDTDGSVAGWEWDLGDGATSPLPSPSHAYGSEGTYPVTLTVTDDAGAMSSVTHDVTVATGSGEDGTLHVSDLDAVGFAQGGSWLAVVTVSVSDETGAPVDGASVEGDLRRGGVGTCTTDADGSCVIELSTNARREQFTVTDVSHASRTYDASANEDPEGDSDGTAIVITVRGRGAAVAPAGDRSQPLANVIWACGGSRRHSSIWSIGSKRVSSTFPRCISSWPPSSRRRRRG